MFARLKKALASSDFTLHTAVLILPLLMVISRGNESIARITYRVYSILPQKLATQGARAAHRTAYLLRKRPFEAALHRTMAYRFDLDSGRHEELWFERVNEILEQCDNAIETNIDIEKVADLLFEALSVLYHPHVHQGVSPSPFVSRPEETSRIFGHACLIRLRQAPNVSQRDTPHDSGSKTEARYKPPNGSRVLVLTDTNFNFMGQILDHWGSMLDVQVRERNLSHDVSSAEWWNMRNTVLDRLRGTSPELPDFIREDIEWADIVFVEWNQALAARLSGTVFDAKLVVRLHKYEAFIQTPILTNWKNVDDLIVITPYMLTLLARVAPDINSQTRVQYVPNVVELTGYQQSKRPAASRNVALIQFGSIVKDPIWGLEVLSRLRQHDPSWQLLLIGNEADRSNLDNESREYFEEFDKQISLLGSSVTLLGHQQNLAATLRDVGVILSSSQVEGAPVSLQEGVASGAFPVVRDWPIVQAIQGASKLYPSEWIVQTPAAAAERILQWSQSAPEPIDELESRRWMIENYDASVTIKQLNQVVFDHL